MFSRDQAPTLHEQERVFIDLTKEERVFMDLTRDDSTEDDLTEEEEDLYTIPREEDDPEYYKVVLSRLAESVFPTPEEDPEFYKDILRGTPVLEEEDGEMLEQVQFDY